MNEKLEKGAISTETRAKILVEALPYIKRYNGKTVVVKYGGNAMLNDTLKAAVMEDIVLLNLIGVRVVLVHGGGPEINEMLAKMNKKSEFIDGLRYTDAETAEIVQMVLSGKVNKSLVNLLEVAGGRAIGLCGADGSLISADFLDKKLGFVGKITSVNPKVITDVLDKGYIPVISTVASDKAGNIYNINADTAAASISGAMAAESLILMTDIKGLLRDKNDENTLIEKVKVSEIPTLVKEGIISGGMIPKIESCSDCIKNGVKKAFIIDGRVPHALLIEVLTNQGIGTMFY